MKKRIFEFHCPNCEASFFLCRDTYLIKDEKSVEYQRLKDGSFFKHQCQSCKCLFDLEYPLIYKDTQRNFLLVNSRTRPEGLEGKCILTRTAQQFTEAFGILDAGLELMDVLPLQKRLEALRQKPCTFCGYDASKELMWFLCDGETIGVHARIKHPAD